MYITCEFELRLVALENKPFLGDQNSIHSGEAILESLEKTIDDWELPRSISVYALSDNVAPWNVPWTYHKHFLI